MVHQSNNEWGLLIFCLIVFKLLSSILGGMVINIQSSNIGYLSHSLNGMGPIVSMEMPLAKAYLRVSHIMEWSIHLILSSNPLYSTRFTMINCLKKEI